MLDGDKAGRKGKLVTSKLQRWCQIQPFLHSDGSAAGQGLNVMQITARILHEALIYFEMLGFFITDRIQC